MATLDVIRAWTDPDARAGLAIVPEHPAGDPDAELGQLVTMGALSSSSATSTAFTSSVSCC